MRKPSKNLRFRRAVFARIARNWIPRYKAQGVLSQTAYATRNNVYSLSRPAGLVWGADWMRNHSSFAVEA